MYVLYSSILFKFIGVNFWFLFYLVKNHIGIHTGIRPYVCGLVSLYNVLLFHKKIEINVEIFSVRWLLLILVERQHIDGSIKKGTPIDVKYVIWSSKNWDFLRLTSKIMIRTHSIKSSIIRMWKMNHADTGYFRYFIYELRISFYV